MKITQEEAGQLLNELRRLRKGAGAATEQSIANIGPVMRKMFDIKSSDDSGMAHAKIKDGIRQIVRTLPPDAETATLAALGIHEQYSSTQLGDRLSLLAEDTQTSLRTVQRRVDESFHQLTETMSRRGVSTDPDYVDAVPDAWENAAIAVNVVYLGDHVEVFESRRVISRVDGLDRLHLGITVPKLMPDNTSETLEISAIHGGNIEKKLAETRARYGFWLKLATPLEYGEDRDFAIRVKLPASDFEDYYVCVLRHRCEKFELTVKFAELPHGVEVLSEAFQMDIVDQTIQFPGRPVDAAGEVRATFQNLSPGLAYGLRWTWSSTGLRR